MHPGRMCLCGRDTEDDGHGNQGWWKAGTSQERGPRDPKNCWKSGNANNQEVVGFSKQPAKADPIEHTTPKTPKALTMPQKNALALDTGNHQVFRSSQLD